VPLARFAARTAAPALVVATLVLAAGPGAGPAAAAPDAAPPKPAAKVVACFLLNAMTRSTPDLPRRETLLRAALTEGCLTLPEASPFRGQGVTEEAQPDEARPGRRRV
jgi:hypothetical protein